MTAPRAGAIVCATRPLDLGLFRKWCRYCSQAQKFTVQNAALKACNDAVYGTVTVSRLHPDCGVGPEQAIVQRVTSAMVISTWIFSVILW